MAGHAHPHGSLENPDTAHETSDINVRAIIWFVVVLTGTAVVIQIAMYALFVVFDKIEVKNDPYVSPLATPAGQTPPDPRLQTTPWTDLQQLRAQEVGYLHSYGWIDERTGVARIPFSASTTVFPVKIIRESGMPSARRLAAARTVGAKFKSASGEMSRRFISSGNGRSLSPVRSPASTWPMRIFS